MKADEEGRNEHGNQCNYKKSINGDCSLYI
jgi:hypothetical protein